MKIVVDESVSYWVVERLRSSGHEVISISELPHRGISDKEVYTIALNGQAILVTRDYHFTNPIRFATEKLEGIIYVRYGNLKSEEEVTIGRIFSIPIICKHFVGN